MTCPNVLFLYRLAEANNDVRGKCIACCEASPRTWNRERWVGYVVPGGPSVEVSQVLSDTVERGCEPGFESVYQEEPFVSDAAPEVRPRLLSIQNYTYVHLRSASALPSVPFFVSFGSVSTPVRYAVTVEFRVNDITQIPDVQFYMERYESNRDGIDKWDRIAFGSVDAIPQTPLPIGCYLPVAVKQDEQEVLGVYRIVESLTKSSAHCELFLCNTCDLQDGSILIRKAVNAVGERRCCELGTITASISQDQT